MAQTTHQQVQRQHHNQQSHDHKKPPDDLVIESASSKNSIQPQASGDKLKNEQDGKRTLIKNQLYLIEQLQLENANLRNERDQLQLENEELKFQLQMISSSNILNHSGATFNNRQLDNFVEDNTNVPNGLPSDLPSKAHNLASYRENCNNNVECRTKNADNHLEKPVTIADQVNQLVSPINQETDSKSHAQSHVLPNQSAVHSQSTINPLCNQGDLSNSFPLTTDNTQSSDNNGNKLLTATSNPKYTHQVQINGPLKNDPELKAHQRCGTPIDESTDRKLSPQEEDENRNKELVEQLYGDSEKVQAAIVTIQRAFRKYQICKRFRTITEQLRHTSNSNLNHNQTPAKRGQSKLSVTSKHPHQSETNDNSANDEIHYASGTTRAAAWDSLSQAANRLAASAAAANQSKQNAATKSSRGQDVVTQVNSINDTARQRDDSNSIVVSPQRLQGSSSASAIIESHQTSNESKLTTTSTITNNGQSQQNPVLAAAMNLQHLESLRKRQYRVGLNIFNKSPEKGVSFLIAHTFIDSTSPYAKTTTGYYQSNQLHLIDKHLMEQQAAISNANIQTCQSCFEEENLKRNVAHFLLHRKGLAKEKIGQYLGNLQEPFNQDVLKYYLQELDFNGLRIDIALRKFSSTFRLPGEAQKIERIVDRFAQRYVQCQQQPATNNSNIPQTPVRNQQQQEPQINSSYKNNLMLLTRDEIFILTFAIIMLNTDLHSPSLKPTSRMSAMQFVNNLRGVFKSQNINENDLIEIYDRVKSNQISTTPDHVTHVMKVQQGLTVTNFQKKELPNLCVPHRRLVCFCRLFEVYDVNKKERVGQHQREIFLFNDLLLVTKLARRVRANTTQLYTYRQSIALQGLCVQLFQSSHYNFGIRLCQRSNDETIIMFNARNELDQSRFVDDLTESIAEMDEMAIIKSNDLVDTIHFKYQERLRRHAMIHSNNSNENNVNNLQSITRLNLSI